MVIRVFTGSRHCIEYISACCILSRHRIPDYSQAIIQICPILHLYPDECE